MLSFLRKLIASFGRRIAKGRGLHVLAFVEDVPAEVQRRTVYVIGEDGHVWSAAMECPCGCGETIQLSMVQKSRPHWEFMRHWDDTVSLTPSVWRQVGCRSHFWLKKGNVHWC